MEIDWCFGVLSCLLLDADLGDMGGLLLLSN